MRLLDLYCGQGGASAGYHAAGFEVVGVDTDRSCGRRYPFEFHHADALEFVAEHGHEFDVIHASPPCQHASAGTRALDRTGYPRLVEATRQALIATGRPYLVENVQGAALHAPLLLCGSMFDLEATDTDDTRLRLQRHRLFETNLPLMAPGGCRHNPAVQVGGVYGGARRDRWTARHIRHGGYVPTADVQATLLGIGWMTEHGLHQAIPPAYTTYLGEQITHLLDHQETAA